jgi:hypothetical protein
MASNGTSVAEVTTLRAAFPRLPCVPIYVCVFYLFLLFMSIKVWFTYSSRKEGMFIPYEILMSLMSAYKSAEILIMYDTNAG